MSIEVICANAGALVAFAGNSLLCRLALGEVTLGGSMLVIAVGAAWGDYSLLGRGVANPASRDQGQVSLPRMLL